MSNSLLAKCERRVSCMDRPGIVVWKQDVKIEKNRLPHILSPTCCRISRIIPVPLSNISMPISIQEVLPSMPSYQYLKTTEETVASKEDTTRKSHGLQAPLTPRSQNVKIERREQKRHQARFQNLPPIVNPDCPWVACVAKLSVGLRGKRGEAVDILLVQASQW